jgi:hypothetical protein
VIANCGFRIAEFEMARREKQKEDFTGANRANGDLIVRRTACVYVYIAADSERHFNGGRSCFENR